jgi:tRNA (mo5U34)-methyltransferase
MSFIEHELARDPTNWWAPNHAAIAAMLRTTGLKVTARPAHEIYVCEPVGASEAGAPGLTYDRAELDAATGRSSEGAGEGRPAAESASVS